jgi:molybdopterin converting factor small subunit
MVGIVKLEVFPWLGALFGAERSAHIVLEESIQKGETVRRLLHHLAIKYPDFGREAFSRETQELSPLVSVFHNGQFLELGEGLDAKLRSGDRLTLLAAWEGG